jgi:Cupin domain
LPNELLPHCVAEAEGPAFWFLNNLRIVKATTESTGGAFSMVYEIAPPGHATPYHLHHVEDEAFYVLDGEYTFICDGQKTVLWTRRVYLPASRDSTWNPGQRFWSIHHADPGDARNWLRRDDAGDGHTGHRASIASGDPARYQKADRALCEISD